MQKKVIALAIAGLVSGAAFAQSNVTIYGVADAAYTYAKGDVAGGNGTNKFSGIQSGQWSGSRIGFKGEEALGNGLKAVFTLEYGVNIDSFNSSGTTSGAGVFNNVRQSFVGLDHAKIGFVGLGRQYAPSYVWAGDNSSFAVTGTTAMNQISGGDGIQRLGGTMHTGSPARWNNSISYVSPVWSGFQARAIYAFGESGQTATNATNATADTSDNGRFGLGAHYANGPLVADVIYQTRLNVTDYAVGGAQNAGTGKDINEWYVGGRYNFKVVEVFGSYQTLSNKNDAASVRDAVTNSTNFGYAVNADAKAWSVGAAVPVSAAGKVLVEYAKISFDANVVGAPDGSSSGWSLGYRHDLSKRTMLYTHLTRMSNDKDGMALGGNGINVGALGESNYAFQAGVRHTF